METFQLVAVEILGACQGFNDTKSQQLHPFIGCKTGPRRRDRNGGGGLIVVSADAAVLLPWGCRYFRKTGSAWPVPLSYTCCNRG